jgi:predicted TIM-barrel fold metal-dependent hydrolase
VKIISTLEDVGPVNPICTGTPEHDSRGLTIVSVDDHVVEPFDLFQGRLPKKYADKTPYVIEMPDGAHAWYIDGCLETTTAASAVAGRPRELWNHAPARFSEIRPGCWSAEDRIRDMDINGVAASIVYPNFLIGFSAGRLLRINDQEYGLALMRAYNDWFHEEWYSKYPDRIVPCQVTWMRDVEIAAAEVRKNAERGFRAVTFSEDPGRLGLPSLWTKYWDPLFEACVETDTTICLHVGTGHWTPGNYPSDLDTLFTHIVMPVVYFPTISQIAATEWLWCGIPTRFPELKLMMAEGGFGWVPAVAARSDYVLEHSIGGKEREGWKDELLPSEVLKRNFYFCMLDEPVYPELVDAIGIEHMMVESDYPHADGTWPHTQERLWDRLKWMSRDDIDKVTYRNAAKLFRLDPQRLEQATAGSTTA